MKKFLIVDGNSLIHRAFYALPLLSNAQGQFTNGAYGFTTMFTKILDEEKPDYVVVCFDKDKKTFRTEQFKDYKGQRKPTPAELATQFALVRQIINALNVVYEELDGYEADDIIGAMVKRGEEAGFTNLILTGDKDALQLVSNHSTVLLIRKGISELEPFDEQAIFDKYALKPYQIIDLKGLMGDSSDNIPGVPGVGEKTALKLLHQYQTVEGIYENLEELTPKLRSKLAENRQLADLSKDLATIRTDLPLEIDLSRYKSSAPNYEELLKVYRELEFKSLVPGVLDRMAGELEKPVMSGEKREVVPRVTVLEDRTSLSNIISSSGTGKKLAIYTLHQGNYFQGDIVALALAFSGEESYVIFLADKEEEEKRQILQTVFSGAPEKKIVYNGKELLVMLARHGVSFSGEFSDVMLGAYLLDPGSSAHYSLEALALEYLQIPLLAKEQAEEDYGIRVQILWQLSDLLERKLKEQEMEDLYRQVELPLEKILAQMELAGIKVEKAQLEVMSKELEAAITLVRSEIYRQAGEEFNLNSPKQLGVILFEKLGLPPLKKTKTGYSTSAEVLDQLAERHEIVAQILEYRTLAKLKSTYVDGLQPLINPETGKLHTSFNQMVTATGRLSSTEPNLQNIPIRIELGRRIRKVFVPETENNILLAGDYSQIELRVLAHISQDPVLQEAFRADQDIHTRTAAEVFGVPMDQVDGEMRRRAKAVNFGIVYGISDYGLSRDLGIPRHDSKHYIEQYFKRYPGVAAYLEAIVAEAKDKGYVTTLLKRRRYLPDILSSNYNVRSFGERTAMNTPIQGSAADIIKVAMIDVAEFMQSEGYRSKMILQVHDELIFDVLPEELSSLAQGIKSRMEQAISLSVPLKVDLKTGPDWYQMEKYQVE
ncbi:DNA polymerase I [Dehalobacterium formicoaceticum]|uniref:DNA polymerase I n=1 Tax=Dehalobacterium formicoaceticum TaxID=51515 RepID=A0ABT1Y5Y0_9FIRM|nr:DNA polymerase I [Dehalobacterium formicoaceticum]MCR6546290.1 DNA polymerase I [Dehalobacterium formicoaceticum]